VTSTEIRLGIERVDDANRRAEPIGCRLRFGPMSKRRALVVTGDVMLKWRLLVEAGHEIGLILQPDLIVAACIDSRLPEGSNNQTHAPVLNLWSGPPLAPDEVHGNAADE
jgi:hypothetical protein